MKEEESFTMSELMNRGIKLIEQDDKIILDRPHPFTLWDLCRLGRMVRERWDISQGPLDIHPPL